MGDSDRAAPVPAGRWPLVGRTTLLGEIVRALRTRQGRGVVLAGGPGVGRSRLAAESVRKLDGVHRIAGTRCGASLPSGSAFANLRPPGTDSGDPVRELTAMLRRRPGQERAVMVVDDAHLLDPGSAALVHHLALQREVRLVVTVRDGEPAPDAVTALWKDDLLRRLEMPSLTLDELALVLEGAYGGQVETRAVRRLAAIADGDLRMLGELVMAGTLSHRDGVWGWEGRPAINGRVRELVSIRFGELDDQEWEALAYLAFGAPLETETLTHLAGADVVERLEARGLVTAAGNAPYAEIVRTMCGTVRARRVNRRLADAAGQVDVLRAATWRMDGGGPADSALFTAGCRRAIAAGDVPLAVRLGRAAVAAGSGRDGAVALATAVALRDSRRPPGAAGSPEPLRVLLLESRRLTAAVLAGDLHAEPAGEETEWDVAGAAYCGHQARLHRLRGEVGRALAWSRDGIRRLGDGPAGFAGLCLGELAYAAALLGDVATARAALAEAYQRRPAAFRAIEYTAELAGPWVSAAAGEHAAAVHGALAVADQAHENGLRLFALHDVVRLGAPEPVADRLWRLADDGCGLLAALFARHAAACACDDGDALDTVAEEFEALGMLLYAAETRAQASRAHHQAGADRRARLAAAAGWTLSRACQGARTPALIELTAPGLTLRQREIAQLAAAGLSNRAIAERLTVSIRTVANHLCAAYERLGVNDRAGLARLLGGLGHEPVPGALGPAAVPAGAHAHSAG